MEQQKPWHESERTTVFLLILLVIALVAIAAVSGIYYFRSSDSPTIFSANKNNSAHNSKQPDQAVSRRKPANQLSTSERQAIRTLDVKNLLLPVPTSKCFFTPDSNYTETTGVGNTKKLRIGSSPIAHFLKMPDRPDSCFGPALKTPDIWIAENGHYITQGTKVAARNHTWGVNGKNMDDLGMRIEFISELNTKTNTAIYADLNNDGYEDLIISSHGVFSRGSWIAEFNDGAIYSALIYIYDPDDPKHPWASSIRSFADNMFADFTNNSTNTKPIALFNGFYIKQGVIIFALVPFSGDEIVEMQSYSITGEGTKMHLVDRGRRKGDGSSDQLVSYVDANDKYPTVNFQRNEGN